MMPTFLDPVAELPAVPTLVLPCGTCAGVGAIQHGSRNPELVTDCPTCGGTGERGAA